MTEQIIISLTSIPPRFNTLGQTLHALLNQKRKADEIHLYVPTEYRRFSEHAFCIPEVPEGITVKVVEKDLGPATKVLPCAVAYRGTNTRIIYCDDDRSPAENWLSSFLEASSSRPNDAIVSSGIDIDTFGLTSTSNPGGPRAIRKKRKYDWAYISRRVVQKTKQIYSSEPVLKPSRMLYEKSGYIDIAEGLGGVSVKPDFFDGDALNIPDVVWAVDDIWLSGCMARKGIGIWASNTIPLPVHTSASNAFSLADSVIEGHNRQEADRACVIHMQEKYAIW